MRDEFIKALAAAAANRPDLMLLTGDLGFSVLDEFRARFPKQFLNVGVAEQNMTGLAAGMALDGRLVFTYSIGSFPTMRCLEQIRNDVCYHDANVKIVCVGGGMSYGPVGASHHATEDLAIMRSLPNMIVVSPCDPWEAVEATKAIIDTPGPAYLRLDKSAAPVTKFSGEVFEIGKARTLRDGHDVTLVGVGGVVAEALEASDMLALRGISSRILSVHTVKPLDIETLALAARDTGGIVTIEEHMVVGGLGGAVAESLMEAGVVPEFFVRIGLQSCFSSVVGSQKYLRTVYGLDARCIADVVLARLTRKFHAGGCAVA